MKGSKTYHVRKSYRMIHIYITERRHRKCVWRDVSARKFLETSKTRPIVSSLQRGKGWGL